MWKTVSSTVCSKASLSKAAQLPVLLMRRIQNREIQTEQNRREKGWTVDATATAQGNGDVLELGDTAELD